MNRPLLNEYSNNAVITFAERPGIEFRLSKKEIGRGASCIVYHAVGSDHTEHLLKEYYPKHLNLGRDGSGRVIVSANEVDAFKRGLARFRRGCEQQKSIRLSNEGLKNFTCNVQGYYQANGTEYIDMTCFNGCTYDEVQEKSVYDLMHRMRTLAQVVGNYHKAGLLHLDIKPKNIYVRPAGETIEDVMLFDFDSATPAREVISSTTLSCTKSWAAPEQILSGKRESICPATDLFAIGEIIFVQLFGRHSTNAERRSFVTRYSYDYNADIFKNMNPKLFPLLDDLLSHTICGVVKKRYQSAEDLIAKMNEIIKLADPKEPFLVSSSVVPEDFFIGRDNELAAIHAHLQSSNILFLSGIGGIGKSELARNYAKLRKENGDYDTVLFATYGGSWMMLVNDDSSIHIANFERSPEEKEPDYYCRKIRKLKELADERTLFVIDNLNEDEFEADSLKQWKDILDLGCKLLITTRLREWEYPILEIDVFPEQSSLVKLFENYCEIKSDIDLTAVQEIIDYVDGHTLTVELIAKQAKASFSTPVKMLTKLKEHGIAQSGKEKVSSIKDNERRRATAFDHITALFDIAELSEQEKYVLSNMSLIPPSGIKAALFAEWCEIKDESGEHDFTTVNALINGGWLDRVENVIKMHPVVAEVAINHTQQFPDVWENYFANLGDALVFWINSSVEEKHKIEEVAYNTYMVLSKRPVATEKIAIMLRDISTFFAQCLYKYDFAILAMEAANTKRLACHDEDVGFEAAIYNDLGVIYDNLGKIKEDSQLIYTAIDLYEKCLKLYATIEAETINVAKTYQNIACAYDNIGKHDLAVSVFEKAINIINDKVQAEGRTTEDVEELSTIYCNVAFHYKKLGFFDEAVDNLKTALAYASLVNMNSERVAKIYHDMASNILCDEFGDLKDAERFARQSLKIRASLFPCESYYLAMSKYVLARTLAKIGGSEGVTEAKALLTVIKPIYIQTLGENNSDVKKLSELLESL